MLYFWGDFCFVEFFTQLIALFQGVSFLPMNFYGSWWLCFNKNIVACSGHFMNVGRWLRRKWLNLGILKGSKCTRAKILTTDMTWSLSGFAIFLVSYPPKHLSLPLTFPILQYPFLLSCLFVYLFQMLKVPNKIDR